MGHKHDKEEGGGEEQVGGGGIRELQENTKPLTLTLLFAFSQTL